MVTVVVVMFDINEASRVKERKHKLNSQNNTLPADYITPSGHVAQRKCEK